MLISYFGKKEGGKFESVNIPYPDIASIKEEHAFFNQVLSNIKKDRNWSIGMFNPIPKSCQSAFCAKPPPKLMGRYE